MRVRHRRLAATTSGILLALGVLTGPGAPASAAAGPTTISATQFTLATTYHQYDTVNAALVSLVGTASVDSVMQNANHTRTSITNSAVLGLPGYSTGFRFDDGDNDDCANYPQGITTSRDAVGTANSGNYDGHQLVVVSWYTLDACGGSSERSRITMVDWDATWPNTYRKVLLVEPTGTASAPSFKDIPVHAGGVSWYGDYLYVADTSKGMRIFDMRKIIKLDTGGTSDAIGCSGSVCHGHNYAYALPQIGRALASTTSANALAWSTISLDRVSASIVMTEYTCSSGCTSYPNRAPRAVRFPFASGSTTFAATTTASQALSLPWYKLNGVASHNGRWWFNSSGSKILYYWTPSAGAFSYSWVSGGECISYWEDTTNPDLLWSLQETQGNRNVFAVEQASYDG